MKANAAKEKAVWKLVDWFRDARPAGWHVRSVDFERELGTLRAARSRWEMSASVDGGGLFGSEQAQIAFHIGQTDDHGTRGLSARRRMELFRFIEATEKTLWRLGFHGSFHVGGHDGECIGGFNKYVAGPDAVGKEIEALSSLPRRLTNLSRSQRPGATAARRRR
jgi:hypothetical protein